MDLVNLSNRAKRKALELPEFPRQNMSAVERVAVDDFLREIEHQDIQPLTPFRWLIAGLSIVGLVAVSILAYWGAWNLCTWLYHILVSL